MSRRTIHLLSLICIVAGALIWFQGPRKFEALYLQCWFANEDPAGGIAACDALLDDVRSDQEIAYQIRFRRQFGLRAAGEADVALQELISLQNSSWEMRYRAGDMLSRLYADAEDFEASIQALETALTDLPPDYPLHRRANMLSRLAWRYETSGRRQDAVRISEQAMALAPDESFTIEIRAWLYRKDGEYETALETLLKALEIGPSDDWPVRELPFLLTRMNRQEELGLIVDELLQANPDLESVEYLFWFELADEYAQAEEENYLKTARAFERGLEVVPDTLAASRISSAWSQLSWRYQKLDRYEEARSAAQMAYDIDPTYTYTLRNKAWLHRLDREYDQALELIVPALAAEPANKWAIGELDRILAGAGRLSDLPEHLTPVIASAVEAEELALERGKNRMDRGREEVAAQIFYALAQHAPGNREYQTRFLGACLGAGESCPPLTPEKRTERPQVTCQAGLALRDTVFRGADSPGGLVNLLRNPDSSWRTAAAGWIGEMYRLLEGEADELYQASAGLIIYDAIMQCHPDTDVAQFTREKIRAAPFPQVNGEEIFADELIFGGTFRQNLLDVAWQVLDYQLPQEGGTDED